jgi:hypothetical protein
VTEILANITSLHESSLQAKQRYSSPEKEKAKQGSEPSFGPTTEAIGVGFLP